MARNPHHSRKSARPKASESGELRIIGGEWRSRRLQFPAVDGVRPTPSRVRETLFNWLAPALPGSHCLDLFAGSGALGLEALSRGAGSTWFVDQSRRLCDALQSNLNQLDCGHSNVSCSDVTEFLRSRPARPADIVFMDPPFRQGWPERLVPLIEQNGWISRGGWIYLEHERELASMPVPAHWQEHRQKQAGQVCYRLYRVVNEG
jgi:16S rRNA (guanine966-N2)-methyltransferase